MNKMYDISTKISNQLPTVRLNDELIFSVNNRKDNMLLVKKYVEDTEKKAQQVQEAIERGEDVEPVEEFAAMDGALKLLIGAKATEALNELNLPLPEYKMVYQTIMGAAQGVDPEKLFQDKNQ